MVLPVCTVFNLREVMMGKIKTLAGFIIILLLASVNIRASETDITITEFRQLYDSLLAGKTLVT